MDILGLNAWIAGKYFAQIHGTEVFMSASNQDINEAVARKLGWIAPTHKRNSASIYPNGQPFTEYKWHRDKKFVDQVPDYCTQIAAAWEIVEFVKTTKRFVQIWSPMGEKHWVCHIEQNGDLIAGAGADTAPMAICLAFLKVS